MKPPSIVALTASALEVRREGQAVLRDVSVAVHAGQWLAVVGPNGSGKSTLLAALAGNLMPRTGQVVLGSRPLADWPARERSRVLAWLPQQAESEADLCVRDVVRLGRLPYQGLYGAWTARDEAAVQRALTAFDLEALANRRMNTLSGGERQRALLARVFATESDVLLLDEPTTSLDAPHQLRLCRRLADHARQGGAAVSVLHDLNLALGADRVAVLEGGCVTALGEPGDPGLHRALREAFGHTLELHALAGPRGPRWVAVPAWDDVPTQGTLAASEAP